MLNFIFKRVHGALIFFFFFFFLSKTIHVGAYREMYYMSTYMTALIIMNYTKVHYQFKSIKIIFVICIGGH